VNVPGLAALALDIVGHQTATVTRRVGSYVAGVWTDAAPSTILIVGTIQPARGNDLQRLPEGKRNEEAIRIITRTELRTAQAGTTTQSDTVAWRGATWEVDQVQTYDGAFYDAVATRRGT
jgi:hypothetical protein